MESLTQRYPDLYFVGYDAETLRTIAEEFAALFAPIVRPFDTPKHIQDMVERGDIEPIEQNINEGVIRDLMRLFLQDHEYVFCFDHLLDTTYTRNYSIDHGHHRFSYTENPFVQRMFKLWGRIDKTIDMDIVREVYFRAFGGELQDVLDEMFGNMVFPDDRPEFVQFVKFLAKLRTPFGVFRKETIEENEFSVMDEVSPVLISDEDYAEVLHMYDEAIRSADVLGASLPIVIQWPRREGYEEAFQMRLLVDLAALHGEKLVMLNGAESLLREARLERMQPSDELRPRRDRKLRVEWKFRDNWTQYYDRDQLKRIVWHITQFHPDVPLSGDALMLRKEITRELEAFVQDGLVCFSHKLGFKDVSTIIASYLPYL